MQGGRLGEQLAEAGDAASFTDILAQPVVVVRTREIIEVIRIPFRVCFPILCLFGGFWFCCFILLYLLFVYQS